MKILFLCTGNSARSQMAEAVFNREAKGAHTAFSAGSSPNPEVNPHAIEVLKRHGYDTDNLKPKHMDQFINEDIDIVITLCDKMKEHCPTFPAHPIYAHFGSIDPAAATGTEAEVQQVFNKVFAEISNRIDLFLYVLKHKESKQEVESELHSHAEEAAKGVK